MDKVRVTGASGFIGSHLMDEPVTGGPDVDGVDSLRPQVHKARPDYGFRTCRESIEIGGSQYMYCMERSHTRKPTISLRLSTDRLSAIDGLVARTGMRSRTEFIERALDAYVQEIREAKVIAVRPWTEKGARAAVVRFLKKRPSAYVSEIAESLGMDFDLAFRVVDSLMEEGTLDRAA